MSAQQQVYGPPQTDAEIIIAAGVVCGQMNVLLNDTTNRFAEAATTLYGPLVAAELGSNRWRFAQHTQQISIFEMIPPLEQWDSWIYKAKLPGDMLILNATFPFVRYAVWGDDILLTGNSPIILKYLRYVPVTEWDVAFRFFMVYQLAEHMAMSVCPAEKTTQIVKMRQHWESRALFANAQSTPQQPFIHKPWWDIRFEGGT